VNKLNLSLTNRQLIAVTLVLTAFLGISAFSLFNAFAGSAETAQKQRLLNYVYTLLTAAEISHDGKLHMQDNLAEPKFAIPNSGLYAQITSGNNIVWQSPSAIGLFLALPYHPGPSEQLYSQINLDNGIELLEPGLWHSFGRMMMVSILITPSMCLRTSICWKHKLMNFS